MKKYMKKILICLLALMLLCASAYAEEPLYAEDGWSYFGYSFGGITYAIPNDYEEWPPSAEEKAAGIITIGGNRDFTIQLRCFPPEAITYDGFVELVKNEPTAELSTRTVGDAEIIYYRNTSPSEYSELYGIALTGLDGMLYKISIFTGMDGTFGDDASVWEIAETIASTVRQQDFSDWPTQGAPEE